LNEKEIQELSKQDSAILTEIRIHQNQCDKNCRGIVEDVKRIAIRLWK
jgi:hypothetical protein